MNSRKPVSEERLKAFLERWAADQAATMHAATVVVGDQLGLYRALAENGAQSFTELARTTDCNPRLVREWLNAQVASGYCEHDPETGTYWLTPEQAACLADADSPTFVAGGAMVSSASHRVCQAFKGSGGIGWHEHHHYLFDGTLRFFEPVYRTHLVNNWIPALDGVRDKLAADGTWMFTEPLADEKPQQSVRARTFFSVSTFVCTPSALSQDGGESLGAQAGEAELRRVVESAGFSRLRRATETPTFMVMEVRP